MDRKEQALALHKHGFNCAQSVACSFGMNKSDGDMDNPKTKRECYQLMQNLIAEFKEKNGSIVCREIKGVDTGNVLRTCDGCIEDAVELLDKYLLGL